MDELERQYEFINQMTVREYLRLLTALENATDDIDEKCNIISAKLDTYRYIEALYEVDKEMKNEKHNPRRQ